MLAKTGVAEKELITRALPSKERRAKGPYALIECFQEIPCNPCSTSCPFHAIHPMEDINELPVLEAELCTGCGICATVCPGLAIFIIDESAGDGTASLSIPYEFSPLPQKGDRVLALDREGRPVCEAQVRRIQKLRGKKTPLVNLTLPLDLVHEVRFFRPFREGESAQDTLEAFLDRDPGTDLPDPDDESIVCRCEGVSLGQIRRLIRQGYTTVDEIKRLSRAGMGPCQARTCGPLIAAEIARMTGQAIEEVQPSALRPPIKPLPIAFYMEEES